MILDATATRPGWPALLLMSLAAGCASQKAAPPAGGAPRDSDDTPKETSRDAGDDQGAPPRPVPISVLEYRAPARDWEREALPIGNGRLGAMILGTPRTKEVQFNVSSLWTGNENPSGKYDDDGFGAYQAFGNLYLELDGMERTSGYVRTLDLATALHTTTWTTPDGTTYVEEAFASHPAEVIAVRLSASGPGRLKGTIRLSGAHGETPTAIVSGSAKPATLAFSGALPNGLKYRAEVAVVVDGCSLTTTGTSLALPGCAAVTFYLAAASDYAMDPKSGWRGAPPGPRISEWLARAVSAGWQRQREEHVADHQRLFGRVSVDFGATAPDLRSLATDERIKNYRPGQDPELIATLFQYGRYLLIGSSRPTGLPANLQGIWNRSNQPPWHCDYHTNINTQMNYWLAEPANLSECHEPLFDLLDAMVPAARAATRAYFGEHVPGFTYRTSHNIFGGQGWEWNTPASAWYALHYFEHYAFTGDLEFLRARAWPYLREVSEFWLQRLKKRADGTLVAPDGWSPEHGPREEGVSYDQQLIWELFADTLEAGKLLKLKDPVLTRVAEAQKRLLGPKVGSWGQLQEWEADRDDPNDRHRHTSHLVAVYPGRQISVTKTPEWAKAAEVSLRARGDTGDSRRSWTWPWRCALWARLQTRDCQRMLDGLLAHNLLPNLITTHPPLQLDGNFGMTAAISEMLLQSHSGELHFLPGIDFASWPNGSFRGLRARGGFEASASWKDGKLTGAEVLSHVGNALELRTPSALIAVNDAAGKAIALTKTKTQTARFQTKRGERYRLAF